MLVGWEECLWGPQTSLGSSHTAKLHCKMVILRGLAQSQTLDSHLAWHWQLAALLFLCHFYLFLLFDDGLDVLLDSCVSSGVVPACTASAFGWEGFGFPLPFPPRPPRPPLTPQTPLPLPWVGLSFEASFQSALFLDLW